MNATRVPPEYHLIALSRPPAQAFGGTPLSEDSRWHFDYFYPAMLSVFFVFTGGFIDALQVSP